MSKPQDPHGHYTNQTTKPLNPPTFQQPCSTRSTDWSKDNGKHNVVSHNVLSYFHRFLCQLYGCACTRRLLNMNHILNTSHILNTNRISAMDSTMSKQQSPHGHYKLFLCFLVFCLKSTRCSGVVQQQDHDSLRGDSPDFEMIPHVITTTNTYSSSSEASSHAPAGAASHRCLSAITGDTTTRRSAVFVWLATQLALPTCSSLH